MTSTTQDHQEEKKAKKPASDPAPPAQTQKKSPKGSGSSSEPNWLTLKRTMKKATRRSNSWQDSGTNKSKVANKTIRDSNKNNGNCKESEANYLNSQN